MALEPLLGAILHLTPLPTVDGAVRELIAEETSFQVASSSSTFSPSVFSIPSIQSPLLPTPSVHLVEVTGKPKVSQRILSNSAFNSSAP